MKTIVLTSTFPRFFGDMQANFVGEQARAWLDARPNDEITILAPHHSAASRSERIDGLAVERFRYLLPERWQKVAYPAILPNIRRNRALALQVPVLLVGEYLAAKRLVRRTRPDLVYAHWIMPQGLIAWQLGRQLGVPYVLQNHSSDLSVFLKLGSLGKAMARMILRDAAHFFCVNVAQKRFALSLLEGAERDSFAKRCSVLPMGVAGAPKVASVGRAGFDVAAIARLSKKKGLNYLIEAAELLAQRGVLPSIGIAGDGEDRAELQAMVKNADVTFCGFLSGREKDRFLAEAQRFAFPSRAFEGDVEGMPVALLEALCRGRPVLASRDTNVEMLPEWPQVREKIIFVEDPANISELSDALERMLAVNPQPAQAAASIMANYRWDRLIWDYLERIDAALRSP